MDYALSAVQKVAILLAKSIHSKHKEHSSETVENACIYEA